MSDSLSFDTAIQIYNQAAGLINENDEDDLELWSDFVNAAAEYAYIRAKWLLKSKEQKAATDDSRTAAHNLAIISINSLARWFDKTGRNTDWRDDLGDAFWKDPGYDPKLELHRKKIGDFCCYVAMIYGLNAR